MAKRWTKRPEASRWEAFGEDGQFGRLNLLRPEKPKQGIAEVREGLSLCLRMLLDYPGGAVLNPRRHAPKLCTAPQYSTQWDASPAASMTGV